MIDKSTNNDRDNYVKSDSNEKLVKWLKDHTDPYKNPWSTSEWKQSDIFLSKNSNDSNKACIDPTANR